MKNTLTLLLLLIAASVALSTMETPALGQCAMCKAALEASTDAAAASKGLNLAAMVLLIPPVSIFAGLFAVFYRFRNIQGKEE